MWSTITFCRHRFFLIYYLLSSFDSRNAGLRFSKYFSIDSRIGNTYASGIDGLSLPIMTLDYNAPRYFQHNQQRHGITRAYSRANLGAGRIPFQEESFFHLFWEIALIPIFFLIDRRSGKWQRMESLNFVLYAIGGSIFTLTKFAVEMPVLAACMAAAGSCGNP